MTKELNTGTCDIGTGTKRTGFTPHLDIPGVSGTVPCSMCSAVKAVHGMHSTWGIQGGEEGGSAECQTHVMCHRLLFYTKAGPALTRSVRTHDS